MKQSLLTTVPGDCHGLFRDQRDEVSQPAVGVRESIMDSRFSEFIGADERGHLYIERCAARDLVGRFGSPLFVTSESADPAQLPPLRARLHRALPGQRHPRVVRAQGEQ